MADPPTAEEKREAARRAEAAYRQVTGRKLSHKRSHSSPDAFKRHYLQLTPDMTMGEQFWRVLLLNLALIAVLFVLYLFYYADQYLGGIGSRFSQYDLDRWLPDLVLEALWWAACAIPFSYGVVWVWRRLTIGNGFTRLELVSLVSSAILAVIGTAWATDLDIIGAAVYWIVWALLPIFYWVAISRFFK